MLKEKVWSAPDDSRDQGKAFLIREQAAIPLERWLERAAHAFAQSGQAIDVDMLKAGLAGWATLGIKFLQGTQWDHISPLLDEMLYACVVLIPDKTKPAVTREMTEQDIEDMKTLATLRREVIELHLGFSIADGVAMLISAISAQKSEASSATQTSHSA